MRGKKTTFTFNRTQDDFKSHTSLAQFEIRVPVVVLAMFGRCWEYRRPLCTSRHLSNSRTSQPLELLTVGQKGRGLRSYLSVSLRMSFSPPPPANVRRKSLGKMESEPDAWG